MTDLHNEKPFEAMDAPAGAQEKSPLPEAGQAEVTHYAYDPRTFEILCRPGQPLSEKRAQRLRELKLYEHVVRMAESNSL